MEQTKRKDKKCKNELRGKRRKSLQVIKGAKRSKMDQFAK